MDENYETISIDDLHNKKQEVQANLNVSINEENQALERLSEAEEKADAPLQYQYLVSEEDQEELDNARVNKSEKTNTRMQNQSELDTLNKIEGNVIALNNDFINQTTTLVKNIDNNLAQRSSFSLGVEDFVTNSHFVEEVQNQTNHDTVYAQVTNMVDELSVSLNQNVVLINDYQNRVEDFDKKLSEEINN